MNSIINQRTHAIVMGASLGGLMTARVLSNHFQRVTIIERDVVNRHPESRHGQPQTQHLHGLLPGGFKVMMAYFPDLKQALNDAGANVIDFTDKMIWYTHGGYRKSFKMNLPAVTMSRPLLEHLVRERVLALPNVELIDNCPVQHLTTTVDKQRVTGVAMRRKDNPQIEFREADLVVDVTGRGSRSPFWLKELGYEAPPTTEVKAKVGYATRTYKRDLTDDQTPDWYFFTPEAPKEKRFAGLLPVEGNRWMISVGGWHGDNAPIDETGFLAFVRALPIPEIYDIIRKSEPLSDLISYKFTSSLRRHYENLSRFPLGYLVLGDAVSSFNPTYGQGMTSASLQAETLDKVLTEATPDHNLAKRFFSRAARVIDTPWQLAIGEDFRFPETIGQRPMGSSILNKYITKVQRATLTDEVVCRAFINVMSLLKPPASLFHPQIIWRVMTAVKVVPVIAKESRQAFPVS